MRFIEIKKGHFFLSAVIFLIIIALVLNPQIYMESTLKGIIVWATAVLPALFPFFFLTKLLTQLNMVERIAHYFQPITSKLFNVPGVASYVFLMSIISGYPVGAKISSELYENNLLTRAQIVRICAFCSTSGPLFIVGTVGAEMFLCKGAGIIMLISHILGAILNGLLYRNYHKKERVVKTQNSLPNMKLDNMLASSIYDSVISILIVGGYVALFFMLIDMLANFHILGLVSNALAWLLGLVGINTAVSGGIVSGIIEITRGCLDLSQSGVSIGLLCIFGTGIISWGGLSIHFQSLTFLHKCKIKVGFYFLQKTTQAILSMLVCLLLLLIFPL